MFGSTGKEPEHHEPSEAPLREVGALLRQTRLGRGEELEDVAEYLRIRPTYLYGLEQGDLSIIPGRTYALGFLRSYAQYLGFDGDDLIAQIRSSVADLAGGAHLHGRTPLSESRLPKIPIVVVSLAALAGVYAGWAYVDHRSQTETELVGEVPDDLREQVRTTTPDVVRSQAAAIEAPQTNDPQPDVGAALEPEAGRPDGADAEASPQSGSAQALTEASSAESGPSAMQPVVGATDPARTGQDREAAVSAGDVAVDQPKTERLPAAAVTPASAAPEQADDPIGPVVANVQPQQDGARATRADLGQAASDQEAAAFAGRSAEDVLAGLEPVAGADTTPTVYRTDAAEAGSRIILRARSSAWVHVSSTNNDYLWVKTLQPGDAFVVPDRPDLVLWTGNAGGIEVIVDGAPLPPLGSEARVVRDVPLQPRALLRRLLPAPAAGSASGERSGGH
jgi:cytoskeleton protein RodZ